MFGRIYTKHRSSGPQGFKEDFLKVFPILSLWKLLTLEVWPIWTPGAWLARFMLGTTRTVIYGPHGFREAFVRFSHYKFMEAIDPRGMGSLNLRGLIGRIYVGNYLTLPHTEHISCGPHSFGEDFYSFSHYNCIGPICCHGNQSFNQISLKT